LSTKQAIANLKKFVRLLVKDGVNNKASYKAWIKADGNKAKMAKIFCYTELDGMPSITSLVNAFFHPKLSLIGLNYTQTAHNTLFEFPQGWTDELRLCRGIVFDRKANLVALPFPKFFNYGENPETRDLPTDMAFEATNKQDGHLGIIFQYRGRIILTSRGSFVSATSVLGNEMLAEHIQTLGPDHSWPKHHTLLVEIIHPDTQVYVDYDGQEEFILIGAYNFQTLEDVDYYGLCLLAQQFNLTATTIHQGKSLDELIAFMTDRQISNQEGYVIRFSSGLRVKIKFQTYIGYMVADKLSYTYLMNRMITGNLQRMLDTLPEEIYKIALEMLGQIMLHVSVPGTPKDKWRKLYEVMPPDQATAYFKTVCRNFVKTLINS
jgi:hypothetical protein